MAKSSILLNRFLSLIFALVILISLFPAVPSFAAEASSSEGEFPSVGSDISSGDAAVLASYTVSGVWVIKSSPSISRALAQAVNFVSNGNSFTRFSTTYNVGMIEQIYINYNSGFDTRAYQNGTWTSDAYRTIDFGSTVQSVGKDFYDWLTSNATQQPTKTNYCVYVDGTLATSWSVPDSSVDLDLRVHEDSISVGFPEHDDEYYSVDYSGSPYLFGGMCKHDLIGCCDYMVSSSPYTITLNKSNPILYLTCAYKYPLYIDPNGGTWNGSSDISEFWEFAGTDTEDIVDPVRNGYTFDGWILSGVGDLNDAGDPPHIYQHGVGSGTLTASWTQDVVPTYTHTISIDGSSYTFTADNAAPPVQIQVLSSGISMTSGNITKSWTYSGADTFVGIQDSSGNTCDVGASFSLLGSSGSDKTSVLTPLTETPSQDTFSTLVNLYDSTGSALLKSFTASSDAASPSAFLAIDEKQLVFDASTPDSAIVWDYTGDGTILGIALTANATSPSYTPGQTMTFGGVSGQNSVISIYLLTDSSSTPEPDPGTGPFETIVVLGGKIYEFVSNEAYPVVKISLSADKVVLSDGVTTYEWRPAAGVEFLGFSLKPNSSEPSYRILDEWWIVQGSADNDIFEYYPFYVGSGDPQYTDAQRVFAGMANFLVGPLMIFFSVEFIPGLSFGGICLLAFCIGLIFWLLKASK